MKKLFGKYLVTITNPQKILLPPVITKENLIHYYDTIASLILPYLKDRPLMMHRFPDGLSGESFYQKEAAPYFPPWIKTVLVPKQGGYNNYIICQNRATLAYIANLACITPHIWLSRFDKLDFPDRMIFDLDPSRLNPSKKDFSMVQAVALSCKELLDSLGLISFVMTTGSRGLHIVVPLRRTRTFKQVKQFALQCAQIIVERNPALATLELRKTKRGNKVFIDILRNQYGATAVAPYSLRAYPHGPIATPLSWSEIDDPQLSPQKYTIDTLFDRLKTIDPWEELLKTKQSLTKAQEKQLTLRERKKL